MSRFAKLFAANAIAVAGLGAAAVALSASAAADPVIPPVVPGVPALSMITDLANPAGFGAVLQTAATALNGASSMIGAPAPNTLPVSPIAVPGTAPAPAAPPAPQPGIGATVVPLLNQIGVPAQLANLAPTNLLGVAPAAPAYPTYPAAVAYPAYPAAAPVAPAVAPVAPAVAPAAPVAAPVAPAAPVAAPAAPAGLNPVALITGLP